MGTRLPVVFVLSLALPAAAVERNQPPAPPAARAPSTLELEWSYSGDGTERAATPLAAPRHRPPSPLTLEPVAPARVKRTRLPLRLLGTAISYGARPSYAIIEDIERGEQRLYRAGEVLPYDATLARIEGDRVILDRDGRRELLERVDPDRSRGTRAERIAAAGVVARLGTGVEKLAEEYAIERGDIRAALDNLNQLSDQIRATPYFEGGEATGFRVFAVRSGSVFDRIGIRNGDIIHSVNQVATTDPADAVSLVQELGDERAIRIELTRDKQPFLLSFEIR